MGQGEEHPQSAARPTGVGGGMADKLGNKYELSWAIYHALQCLRDERRSMTFEDVDPDLAEGSEFTFVDEHGITSVTQVKRQHGVNNHWTIAALRSRGVFAAAVQHVSAGREYHFRSTTPCAPLRSLAERARHSANLEAFLTHHVTQDLRRSFDELAAPDVLKDPETAWHTLRGMWFEARDEQELLTTNRMLASTTLTGAADSLLSVAIGSVLLDNLRQRLTRSELLASLRRLGIDTHELPAMRFARDEVRAVTESWYRSVERELLNPYIVRSEADDLLTLLGTTRLALVVGAGGDGKSAVIHQATKALEARGAEVLSFRLDRCGAFSSTRELGQQLGLSASPVVSLSMAADEREAVLVIDQLDAVSLASGRLSERYDVVAELVQEAMCLEGIKVLLVCRLFDVENDYRIRRLDARDDVQRLTIGPLSEGPVRSAVAEMGLDASKLTRSQLELLGSPLNLVLLETVASHPNALKFTSRGSLFEAFWKRKRQIIKAARPEIRFNEVLSRVANAASDRQTLSVPVEILDPDDFAIDADVLASEQVLSIADGRVSFFHETFFDFTFARQWLSRDESLVSFLCRHEQELFRRAQVRQILELLRERDPSRFNAEILHSLTDKRIRSHLKETILAVLAGIVQPNREDLALIQAAADSSEALGARAWKQIARPNWFNVLDSAGVIAQHLDASDPILQDRGALWLAYAGEENGPTVASLLASRRSCPGYSRWLRQVVDATELHSNRAVFDLLLDAIRSGAITSDDTALWFATHDLATREPQWALELLIAYFIQSPWSLAASDEGRVTVLASREYGLTQLIKKVSRSEPGAFADAFVPYLLSVMRVTAYDAEGDRPVLDRHWGLRLPSTHESDNAEDALYDCTRHALQTLSVAAPHRIDHLLRLLERDPHGAAQNLLYHALIASPVHHAEWAAELLLQGKGRLRSGYLSDPYALSRELAAAVSPYVSDVDHAHLEDSFLSFRSKYERGPSHGYTAFKFLSALDKTRMGMLGTRRLAEYQRKFELEEPPPATGIISYTVSSPITSTAAERMSDDQWLRAFARHDGEGRAADPSKGGARELSEVLKQLTAKNPSRFAGLALQMTKTLNPSYPCAILWGFGEAAITSDARPLVFDAIRHIMNLRIPECDRWVGWSVRQLLDETPIDIVQLITDRALSALDPSSESPGSQNNELSGRDLVQHGINTARGTLAQELGDLLIHDVTGKRTAVVAPHLEEMATDPALSVRACVAHTIAACLRFARPVAYAAFKGLIETDDVLLASRPARQLMIYIGNSDAELIDPVIARMMDSPNDEVRQAGGCVAAIAALQWERGHFMTQALAGDAHTRTGVAEVCAARITDSANSTLLVHAIGQLMQDHNEQVSKAAAGFVRNIRGQSLVPLRGVLRDLIKSPSYIHASPQVLLCLQEASDGIDDLVDLVAHRFLDMQSSNIADLRERARGDAHRVSELVVRALSQSRDRNRVSALLDVLDRLVEMGVYGVDAAIQQAERR
ncbi:hypothetical protein [Microbacterium sp.]|uniref:hypothetical protein n=1 Tax=Microbacterium sp. TaxID=51671 RepID=UPI0035B40BF4